MSLFDPPINENFDGALVGQPGRTFRRVHDTNLDQTIKVDVLGCGICCFETSGVAVTDQCAKVDCSPVNDIWTHYEELK